MPSPGALWQAFEVALGELEHRRGREPRRSGYAARSQKAVFEAGLRALAGSLRAIYQEGQHDNPNALAFPHEGIPEMQVVASSPGSGKSTSAKAFMLAVAREGLKDKYPLGSAFVVQHIETAADAYEELTVFLPDQVAVWSSEHDAENPAANREPRFTVAELEDYEQVLPDYRGMVLLDATADIDGLNELCPWRRPVEIPKATYERLEIVHVPSVNAC
jgi:hypothetical protein